MTLERVAGTAQAERSFNALVQGGKVVIPLGQTFWSPCFGMLEDRFGVGWMMIVAASAGVLIDEPNDKLPRKLLLRKCILFF